MRRGALCVAHTCTPLPVHSAPLPQELLDHNHALRSYKGLLESLRKECGSELHGKLDQLVEQMSRIFKSTATTPALFVPLIHAHTAHIGGDHTHCPTLESVGEGKEHDGCIFHCPIKCICETCIPKKDNKARAEAAPGPKKARDTQVYGTVSSLARPLARFTQTHALTTPGRHRVRSESRTESPGGYQVAGPHSFYF